MAEEESNSHISTRQKHTDILRYEYAHDKEKSTRNILHIKSKQIRRTMPYIYRIYEYASVQRGRNAAEDFNKNCTLYKY